MRLSLRREKRLLKALESYYSQASDEIGKRIQRLMDEYGITGLISKVYQKRFQESLKKQIDETLDRIRQGVYQTIEDYRTKCYENGFLGAMYDMQGQGIPLVFPIDPEKMVKAITLDSRLSRSLYSALGINLDKLKKAVRDEISRCFAQGLMYAQVASHLNIRMHTGLYNAFRIARTEGQRIQNEAAYQAQIDAVEKGADIVKEWCGILDDRIRPSHAELHGQLKAIDEYFEVNGHHALHPCGFGIASEDINCRCTILQRARWAIEDEGDGIIEADSFSEFMRKWNGYTAEFNGYKQKLGRNLDIGFGEFVRLRNSDDFHLLKNYAQYIVDGDISIFANFSHFMNVSEEIDKRLVGLVTINGIGITGKSDHFIARIIGSESGRRDGVTIEGILEALTNKNAKVLKPRENGSQRFRYKEVEVSVNINTGNLIQCNPSRSWDE